MTKEQIQHYLKGGKFLAIYDPPKKSDLSSANLMHVHTSILIYQNVIHSPIISIKEYEGQHAFNSDVISGWFPEQDVKELIIQDDFIDNPEPLPAYMFKLHYTTREQVVGNFGNAGEDMSLPFSTGREYSHDAESYVLKLSDPKATKVEKAIYTGETETPEWKTIFEL